MRRPFRIAGYVALGLLIGVAAVVVLVWALTRTEFGVERVGRFVVGQIEEDISGELRVGRITSEGLLGGVTVHDVTIADSVGRPFVRLDSARLSYDWRTLLGGRIVFDRVVLYEPDITIEQLPGDTLWNYERLFADTTPDEPDNDRLVLFERARLVNGRVVVRYAWEPDEDEPAVEPEDTARLIIEPAPGGLVRVLRFEDVDAVLPRALWESPVEEGKLFQIASLSTRGYLYEEPFELRDLRGVVTIRDSLLAFEATHVELPNTRAAGIGQIITEDEQSYDIRIELEEVAFADLQWLYPRLPEEGGGELVLRIQTQPEGTLWLATDARLHAPETEVAGSFGLVTGDSLYFTRVDLRASPLNVALLEEILPVDLPVEGLMVGTVEVEGPISALTTRGELRLTTAGADASTVSWSGTVDLHRPFGAENLRAEIPHLDLALLTAFDPNLRLVGALSGRLTATGRLDQAMRFSGSVQHQAPGRPSSRFDTRGTVRRVDGRAAIDARVVARPLSLDALGSVVAALRESTLTGTATGPIRIRGSLDDLNVDADLETPGGPLAVEAQLNLSGRRPRVHVEGESTGFRLDRIVKGVLPTTLRGRLTVDGAASDLASSRGTVRLNLDAARIGALAVRDAEAAVRVRDGLLQIERFLVQTDAGDVRLSGGLGLVAGRSDSLHIELVADSLAVLRPFFFPDTTLAPDAQGILQQVAGRLRLDAAVVGTIRDFEARGSATLEGLVYDDVAATGARLRFALRRGAPDSLAIRATLESDSLVLYGKRFARARITADYDGQGGQIALDATGPNEQAYGVGGRYVREAGSFELRLSELVLGTPGAMWALANPTVLRWGERGMSVDSLRLERKTGGGRIAVRGRLPWGAANDAVAATGAAAAADFRIDLERVPTADWFRIVQADSVAGGVLDGRVDVGGPAHSPVMSADLAVVDVGYGDVQLDRVSADLRYAEHRLEARIRGVREGERVLAGEGRIPIDLSLGPVPQRRLDQPLRFDMTVDSLPVSVPLAFLDGFEDVEGWFTGRVGLGGTTRAPALEGQLALQEGQMSWRATGVHYRDVAGTLRLEDESTVVVDLGARTEEGSAAITGTVRFTTLTDPELDLVLRADEFQGALRSDVELVATGELGLTGSYTQPFLSGTIQVDEGALYLEQLWRQYQVVDLESPFLFDVVDTTTTPVRQFLPDRESEFLRNLVIDSTTVQLERDFWLRGRAVNAEVAGELQIAFDPQAEDLPLSLSGTLDVVRGTYQLKLSGLPARQFQIEEGTVEFVGTPGINPTLDITAAYRVRTMDGEPLDVRALVTGTLRDPRAQLASDAEPPISESDLASYVIFGRPSYMLTSGQAAALNSDAIGGLVGSGILGFAATGLESFARNYFPLPLDYVAITPPPNALANGEDDGDAGGSGAPLGTARSFLIGTEVEVGSYWTDELFVGFRYRVGSTPGVRLEWRFDPTWAVELFAEDRFAHAPSFGQQDILFQPVYGLFLFREWGY